MASPARNLGKDPSPYLRDHFPDQKMPVKDHHSDEHTLGSSNGRTYKVLSPSELEATLKQAKTANKLIQQGKKSKNAVLEALGWAQLFPLVKAIDKHHLLLEQERCQSLQGRVYELEKSLDHAEQDANGWWRESRKLHDDLFGEIKMHTATERTLHECKTELSKFRGEKKNLEEKCAKLATEYDPLFREYNEKCIALCEAEEKIGELERKIVELKQQDHEVVANTKELLDEINAENGRLSSQLKDAQSQIAALNRQLTASQAAQKTAEEKVAASSKRKAAEETELRDERIKRQTLEKQVEKYQQLFADLQRQIANFCPGK